jgi:hypothetical protein
LGHPGTPRSTSGDGIGLSSTGDLVTISASGVSGAVSSALAGKQDVLTQPGFGTELLYSGSKLKRIAFGSGLAGGTDVQPDGSQTVGISVSPNLAVSSLTPPASTPLSVAGGLQVSGLTQLQGLEASGLVAQQVVWVTGSTGAPNSIMFPGSLALGKWRIRGNATGRFVLERFDDDGEVQTDGWLPVAAFTHDPDTNAMGLASKAVRVDTLSPFSIDAAASVTCDGPMTVTGRLVAGGVQLGNNSVLVPGSLTVGGVSFASLNFNAIELLRKVVNLSTGAVELRVDTAGLGGNPFFCAGKVGFNGAVLATSGQVNFTVVRTGSGVYSITYATPHPQEHNIVQVSGFGYATVSNTSATGFNVQLRNTGLVIADHTFYFSVLA